jgi:hypothetical protein
MSTNVIYLNSAGIHKVFSACYTLFETPPQGFFKETYRYVLLGAARTRSKFALDFIFSICDAPHKGFEEYL